nr:metalloregulator ArsR/SmtB family transcription factor [uncultured Halomonas sp.]
MSTHQPDAQRLDKRDNVIVSATNLLKAMANENRLRILCLLDDGELSVSELNAKLALSQSALSQHLAILRREGLVATRRSSQTIYYSLQGNEARTVVETLAKLYAG